MMDITQKLLSDAKVLWDFHVLKRSCEKADFILAMGSHDERVAVDAARLMLEDRAPLLVTSGGFGKVTRDHWHVTEGEHFAEIARRAGVPDDLILVEPNASNTGDNVVFTRDLLAKHGLTPGTGIIVTKPYMCRRAYATAAKQWPRVQWCVTAPAISFEDYPTEEVSLRRMISLMVGDLQRLKIYGENGFQTPTEIPSDVWQAFERLRDAGFHEFVIKDK